MIPLRYSLRSLTARRATSATTASTVGLVILVFLTLAGLARGMQATIVAVGSTRNVILISPGALSLGASAIDRRIVGEVRLRPEVATAAEGVPLVSPELAIADDVFLPGFGRAMSLTLRGVRDEAYRVHPNITIVSGHPPHPGSGEVLLGQQVAKQLGVVATGQQIKIGPRHWKVAGLFAAAGSALESEIWADLDDVFVASRRRQLSAVTLAVRPGNEPRAVAAAFSADPRLGIQALTEPDFYKMQASDTEGLGTATIAITAVLGLAAVFGAMNTLYAAVMTRLREIGCLRALGFSRRAVLASFALEGIVLALVGGGAACLLAWCLSGIRLSTLVDGQVLQYDMRIEPGLIALALALSAGIGATAAALPALRAARMDLRTALRRE